MPPRGRGRGRGRGAAEEEGPEEPELVEGQPAAKRRRASLKAFAAAPGNVTGVAVASGGAAVELSVVPESLNAEILT